LAAQPTDWETITPKELVPAIKHLRGSFDALAFNCWQCTVKLCYLDLHLQETSPTPIAPYAKDLAFYQRMIGPSQQKRFADLLRAGTPPSVFAAYFDLHRVCLALQAVMMFEQILQIGVANSRLIKTSPVEWTKAHLKIFIGGRRSVIERWIKEACDKQLESRSGDAERNLIESIYWTSWRAPKLIRMEPSGSVPLDLSKAWTREDEAKTEELLGALSTSFIDSIRFQLNRLAGDALVQFAQGKYRDLVLQAELQDADRADIEERPKGGNFRSPYKNAIRQALISLGASASAQQVATWINEHLEEVQFQHLAKKYGPRIAIGGLYRTNAEFRGRFDRDVSKIRKSLQK
jgi:hypothetical protein